VIRYTEIKTPVGKVRVAADDKGLIALSFPDSWSAADRPQGWTADRAFFRDTETALREFFAKGKALTGFTVGARRGTAFQIKVWDAIAAIPFGETRSYGEIAEAIGHPGAARAVGTACGANPLPLFVPCHRVLAARGAIGGYGPTGIETKKKLLKIEGSWE
jgi:methylated-DNA-[protein]-cysteine S-methyltransferase